jgi:hypothetical protein
MYGFEEDHENLATLDFLETQGVIKAFPQPNKRGRSEFIHGRDNKEMVRATGGQNGLRSQTSA